MTTVDIALELRKRITDIRMAQEKYTTGLYCVEYSEVNCTLASIVAQTLQEEPDFHIPVTVEAVVKNGHTTVNVSWNQKKPCISLPSFRPTSQEAKKLSNKGAVANGEKHLRIIKRLIKVEAKKGNTSLSYDCNVAKEVEEFMMKGLERAGYSVNNRHFYLRIEW